MRAVLARNADVLFSASTEPTEQHLWGYLSDGRCVPLTIEPGVHTGTGTSSVLVVSSASLSDDGVQTVVRNNGVEVGHIASFAEPAPFSPRVSISKQGRRELRTALVQAAFAAKQPSIIGENLGLAGEPPADRRGGGLNAAETAICAQLGLKHSEFIQRKRGRADFLSLERAGADIRNAEIRGADLRNSQD